MLIGQRFGDSIASAGLTWWTIDEFGYLEPSTKSDPNARILIEIPPPDAPAGKAYVASGKYEYSTVGGKKCIVPKYDLVGTAPYDATAGHGVLLSGGILVTTPPTFVGSGDDESGDESSADEREVAVGGIYGNPVVYEPPPSDAPSGYHYEPLGTWGLDEEGNIVPEYQLVSDDTPPREDEIYRPFAVRRILSHGIAKFSLYLPRESLIIDSKAVEIRSVADDFLDVDVGSWWCNVMVRDKGDVVPSETSASFVAEISDSQNSSASCVYSFPVADIYETTAYTEYAYGQVCLTGLEMMERYVAFEFYAVGYHDALGSKREYRLYLPRYGSVQFNGAMRPVIEAGDADYLKVKVGRMYYGYIGDFAAHFTSNPPAMIGPGSRVFRVGGIFQVADPEEG